MMNDASAGVARNNRIRPDPAGRASISTMKAAIRHQICAGMQLDQRVAAGAGIVDANIRQRVAGNRVFHDHRRAARSRTPPAACAGCRPLCRASVSRTGASVRSALMTGPPADGCSWSSTTAKLKPIVAVHVTFGQPRRLLEHPPQPFHADRLPSPGGAADQSKFDLHRLADAEGPARRQHGAVGVDEYLAAGRADRHDQKVVPMLADRFAPGVRNSRRRVRTRTAAPRTSQATPFRAAQSRTARSRSPRCPRRRTAVAPPRYGRHAHQFGGHLAAGHPRDTKAAPAGIDLHRPAVADDPRGVVDRPAPTRATAGSLRYGRYLASPPGDPVLGRYAAPRCRRSPARSPVLSFRPNGCATRIATIAHARCGASALNSAM